MGNEENTNTTSSSESADVKVDEAAKKAEVKSEKVGATEQASAKSANSGAAQETDAKSDEAVVTEKAEVKSEKAGATEQADVQSEKAGTIKRTGTMSNGVGANDQADVQSKKASAAAYAAGSTVNRKKIIANDIIWILVAVILVFLLADMASKENVPNGDILVIHGEDTATLQLDSLAAQPIEGKITGSNGKTKEIDGYGISLRNAIVEAGFTPARYVTVASNSNNSAVVTVNELKEKDKAYLLVDEDNNGEGKVSLVVFGDKSNERYVTDIRKIIID